MMTAVDPRTIALIGLIVAGYWCARPAWRVGYCTAATLAVLLYVAPLAAVALLAVTASSWLLIQLRVAAQWRIAYAVLLFLALAAARWWTDSPWFLLGAAFTILKVIHVVVDAKDTAPFGLTLASYTAYLLFPPTFAVGPIQRAPQFLRELKRSRWDAELFSTGLERLLFGYVFLVLLADTLVANKLQAVIATVTAPTLRAWLDCFEYGAVLYLSFAGYSHIAIGLANLLCVRVPENFSSPFLAMNIGDFWRRWHITLGTWCRDYVNTPVMALTRNRSAAIVTSMIVLGFWHETSLRYLLWGGFHGLGIVVWRTWQAKTAQGLPTAGVALHLYRATARVLTLLFVIASFAITKESNLSGALDVLSTLVGAH